jgi:hypothetical protein
LIVFFGPFFESYKSCPKIFNFIRGKGASIVLTKNGLGYILGDFFSQTHLATLNSYHGYPGLHGRNAQGEVLERFRHFQSLPTVRTKAKVKQIRASSGRRQIKNNFFAPPKNFLPLKFLKRMVALQRFQNKIC